MAGDQNLPKEKWTVNSYTIQHWLSSHIKNNRISQNNAEEAYWKTEYYTWRLLSVKHIVYDKYNQLGVLV